ncbi:hypothetical protein ACOSQ4_021205 [Xanthoceras sorbifolium]
MFDKEFFKFHYLSKEDMNRNALQTSEATQIESEIPPWATQLIGMFKDGNEAILTRLDAHDERLRSIEIYMSGSTLHASIGCVFSSSDGRDDNVDGDNVGGNK